MGIIRIPSPAASTGGNPGAMQHVATQTISGAAVASVTFSGLDLAASQVYVLHGSMKQATGTPVISLQFNGDATATNYWRELLTGSGGSASASNANDNVMHGGMASGEILELEIRISADVDGYPRARFSRHGGATTDVYVGTGTIRRTNTANVASITVNSSVAASIAIGSMFRLFKITG